METSSQQFIIFITRLFSSLLNLRSVVLLALDFIEVRANLKV